MSLLAASEKDRGQAESALEKELEMWLGIPKSKCWSHLERCAIKSESLVNFFDMDEPKRVVYPRLDAWI